MSKTTSVYNRKKEPGKQVPAPPSRMARLLVEARWLALIVVTLFFFIVLYTYSRGDPGWSHAVHTDKIHNLGGRAGAWLSDLLLFTFGLSAWWCGLWLLRAILHGYRRIASLLLLKEAPKPAWFRDRFLPNLGFLVLITSSSTIEYLRMYSMKIPLPRAPGGVLGEFLGTLAMRHLGFTGATLILLLLFATGFSLFLQMSWLQFAEKVGALVEGFFGIFIKAYRVRQDRKIGQAATIKREEALVQEKARVVEAPPIHIEPQITEVPKSDRAEKERQVVLFPEHQELPPLSLLDAAPASQDTLSVETLEFTSRLIEKKLSDFGVSARVVTAHPGPVVTRYEIDPATGVKGSAIVNLGRDLARSLSLVSIRVIETIPGKNYMALELPNPKRQVVRLTEIL
ncbi:MAG: DNA translocase FtsK 4TM domain-containing protein, partial [Burkholderiaceae bacterium]|nr:DNA translocase FtsK 4TM domain-containing protein [Burkholderiaceae bacterium]